MPIVEGFTQDYAVPKTTDFLDTQPHLKARNDFCYLVNKCGLAYAIRLKHIVVSGSTESFICDNLVLGANVKDSMVVFPKSCIDTDEKAYVSIVLYDGNDVNGVYMFDTVTVKSKTGMFSMFKDLKKENCYGIALKGYNKWGDKKFGYILKDYIKV